MTGHFRIQERIRILPGVHVNLSKRGVSLSLGGPGASINFSKRGTRTTVGLPGTGISYVETSPHYGKQPCAIATHRDGGGYAASSLVPEGSALGDSVARGAVRVGFDPTTPTGRRRDDPLLNIVSGLPDVSGAGWIPLLRVG